MIRSCQNRPVWVFSPFLLLMMMVSCNQLPEEKVSVDDGIYIVGKETLFPDILEEGRFKNGVDAITGSGRSSLFEMHLVLAPGKEGFQVVRVEKGRLETWGPGPDFSAVLPSSLREGEPLDGISRGSYTESGSAFTVAEEGLYHVTLDTELQRIAIARMKWGLTSDPGSPGSFTYLYPDTDTGLSSRDFYLHDVELANEFWHFNYSGGEHLFLDTEHLAVSCIIGGSPDSLITGGGSFRNPTPGMYDISFAWDQHSGYSADLHMTDTLVAPEGYPEELFLIGDGVGGWDFGSHSLPMIPVLDHPNAFWRIAWLEPSSGDSCLLVTTGNTFEQIIGVADTTVSLPGNMPLGDLPVPCPPEPGYYLVWVDLEADSLSIAVPEVYLIGEVVGGMWDAPVVSARFLVDNENELITLTRELTTGYLRMHVWHPWHYHWWQHELVIRDGKIEYRGNGNALNPVKVTGGSKSIELDFRKGTGTILQGP